MPEDCLFCKIIEGSIPSTKVHEDDRCVAIEDINPQAPTHVLVIPKKHIPTVLDLAEEDADLVGYLHLRAAEIARERNLTDGFRLVLNCNAGAGQTVYHLHLHILGGREFRWPPG
ncbi:MAG: histidine triad nucleotide-binding protein [Nitrospinota bacterium]